MLETFVIIILLALAAYSAVGIVFAVVFHAVGLKRLDHGVAGAGWFFRLLITPGIIGLWPLLAWKWRRSVRGDSFAGSNDAPVSARQIRSLHRLSWKLLAVLVPFAVAAALFWRPDASTAISQKLPVPTQAQPR